MRTIGVIISVVVIPVIFVATILNQIALEVECGVEGQKVKCEAGFQRPATVRREYLDMK